MKSGGSSGASEGRNGNVDTRVDEAADISNNKNIRDAEPSSPKARTSEEVGTSSDHEDSDHHSDAGTSGGEGGAESEENLKKEGDLHQEENHAEGGAENEENLKKEGNLGQEENYGEGGAESEDNSKKEGDPRPEYYSSPSWNSSSWRGSHSDVGSSGAEGGAGNEKNMRKEGGPRQEEDDSGPAQAADSTAGVQYLSATFGPSTHCPPLYKSNDALLVDIPVDGFDTYKRFTMDRSVSNYSDQSGLGDQCRICQQHTEEDLMELGCECRGELAKSHRTCVDRWFGNKGTNICEVCQHVATNVPLPAAQPTPYFWVWRAGGGQNSPPRLPSGHRFNPLWPALLLILLAGLVFDILISIFVGSSALPVNIILGVLAVLGLGTACRLTLECYHEHQTRRNIRRMEREQPNFDDIPPASPSTNIQVDFEEDEFEDSPGAPPPPRGGFVPGSAEAAVAAMSTPDVLNR